MPATVAAPGGMSLIAATFTAFHADGSLNLAAIEGQAEALLQHNLRGVFVCGSTGEGSSLTSPERMAVAQRWCEVAGNDLEVIVHVGHASVEDARLLAAHAEQCGAAGVAAVAPYYFRPGSVQDLVACNAYIAAGAPRTRYYTYHIPSLSHVDFAMTEYLPLAAEAIPNFAGVKFTDEDLATYALCVERAADDYEIFFGRDEMALAGMSLGATSGVGSTYNFAAPIYQRVSDAFVRGDLATARAEQLVATRMIETASAFGGLPAFKALTSRFGPDLGPSRLPMTTLDDAAVERLLAELERQGFFAALRQPAQPAIA